MANVANTTLTTNFNDTPYYDDYDVDKNFYRILYRPGYAVQARELTQSQTMLQKQIDRFGKHVFKEGSIVLPGQFGIEANVAYVKIQDTDAANNDVDVDDLLNQEITGATNGVKAYVIEVADGAQSDANTKTLFVRYQSAGSSNSAITTFQDSEPLVAATSNAVVLSASSTGFGSRFIINEGVLFAKEHFIHFPSSSIILSRYSGTPTCRVGFDLTESIVRYTQDTSLLDPALEASNFSAPGADRFSITPTLRVMDIDDTTGAPDFVELFTIRDGVIEELYERSQYNILQSELAKRTSDESGDYYVNGLNVRVRENYDSGTNDGYLTTGSTANLSVGVEPGTAYVKGYEVGKLVTTYKTIPKSSTYSNVNGQLASATIGNYIKVNEFVGSIPLDAAGAVWLMNTAENRVTNTTYSTGAPAAANIIGQARVASIEYDSGVLGTVSGNVRMYLYDVKMNGTNSFANTKAVWYDDASADLIGDVVLNSNNQAVLYDSGINTLLYSLGRPGIRTVRDATGSPDMSFTFRRTEDVTIGDTAASNQLVLTITPTGEVPPYGTTTLSTAQKQDIILTLNADANIALPAGTVSGVTGQANITGSGTTFTNFNVGDKFEVAGDSTTYIITVIASETSMNLSPVLASSPSGAIGYKAYKAGDIIDLNTKGIDAGTVREVTSSAAANTISFNLQETYSGTISGTVSYKVSRSSAQEADKLLRNNRYVTIDCSTHPTGANGPFSLGVADLYKIHQIRVSGSSFSTNTNGTIKTSFFNIDDGQRDAFYDFASITPKSSLGLTASDHILVEFSAFEPSYSTSQVGYFSVDSYPIDDVTTPIGETDIRTENLPIFTSPRTKMEYDLRDYLDFRPVKTNTALYSTTVGGATGNPSANAEFKAEAGGLRMPVPSSQLTFDYSYYKARRDLVVIDKEGNISVVQGIPDSNPKTPPVPGNAMALATLYITPFPSLAPNYAQILNRKDLSVIVRKAANKGFTMRDIGVLRDRIVNLEYYASLTALEKNAVDMQILDENGLTRFKNGIFVDTFRDHKLGDTESVDYKIVVDPREKSIRPIFTMDSVPYEYLSASGTTKTGDLVTLPYTETTLINQPKVTSQRNVEVSSYRFIGNLFLTPDQDIWVDTEYAPDNEVIIGPNGNNIPQGTSTEWNSWQKKVVGYNLYKKDTGELLATFDANQKDLAFNNAYWLARNREFNRNTLGLKGSKFESIVETVYESSRTGVETFQGISESSESIGDRVIDVALIPYIRPQTIKLDARGLKANTAFYTFFDEEDMSSYVTPLTATEFANWPVDGAAATEGDLLTANATGQIYAALRLPDDKRFRVGTKEVKLTDNSVDSDLDASSAATTYFVAQGLVQYKQDTILTTRQVIQIEKDVEESSTQTEQYVQKLRPSCTAYSFLPKAPKGEEGIFLTSVDVYFAAKHPTLGVWVEIREMNSTGGITRNQVPYSEVWVESANLTVSTDASTPHNFVFPSPVFLYSDVQYAFVIHTIGLNPDTYIWISRLGEEDVNTGAVVTSRPLTGTLYTTNNNLNWDIVPDVDLLCTFYRASFTTGSSGTVTLGNKPVERLQVSAESSRLNSYGEGLIGRDVLTLSGISGTFYVGDAVQGNTSNATGIITAINGSDYSINSYGFQYNEILANTANGTEGTVSVRTRAGGILNKYITNGSNSIVEVLSSNGNFTTGDVITGSISGTTANVDVILNHRYSVVDFEPSYLNFNKTTIGFEMRSTSNASVQGTWFTINENDNYYFSTEQAVLSRSNEVANLSGERSNQTRITMKSDSDYQSPVLDISRTHSIIVDNIINSNTTNELLKSDGALINKYISMPVTLAEGQDAEDMLVILTAYRPPNTEVYVWLRLLNNEDGTVFNDLPWILLEAVDSSIYSSASDLSDFREMSFKIPDANLTGINGSVQYTNTDGSVYDGFKTFAVKIGLADSDNSAVVPRVADLRCIALQK